MKRFSAIIQHTSGDKHSLVVSSWDTDTNGSKINIEAHNKTHNDVARAFSSMRNFIEARRTPDATPPTLLPYAVEIPLEYRLPFRNGVFKLNAFEVPLDDYQNTKVVNVAYFQWAEFRAELDTKDANGNFVYQALKDSLMDLWDYVGLQVANQNLIVL
jgi:hypothetical protein